MQSWKNVSWDCLQAAQMLRDKHPRSSISRAYYAAFSAGVWLYWRQQRKPKAGHRETPSHKALPGIIARELNGRAGKDASRELRYLYDARLDADYRTSPGIGPDSRQAGRVLQKAAAVMRLCGV